LYFLNSAGEIALTILSVLCADKIVATSSWNGLEWSSAHFASG